jgi:hypothetical protein
LSVRGDSPIGFSSYLPQEKRRRVSVEEFRPAMDVPAVPQLQYKPGEKKQVSENSFPSPLPSKQRVSDRVKALDMRGRELALHLDMPDTFVSGRNVFAIRGKGDFRRIEVLVPLAPLQDKLAVKALLESDLSDGERVTVLWMRGEK